MNISFQYKVASIIGSAGGAIVGTVAAIVYNYLYPSTTDSNLKFAPETIVKKLTEFKKAISSIDLNCPKGNFHLKNTIKTHHKDSSTWSHELHKLFNAYLCSEHNKLSQKNIITTHEIMAKVNEGIKLVDEALKKGTSPILLAIGENHLNQESFLIETLILTHLKRYDLSTSLLIERAPNYNQNERLNFFKDINPFIFAKHVLGYKLIGIDPLNEDYSYSGLSRKRESKMGESIAKYVADTKDKVIVVSIGAIHLPMFEDIYTKNLQVIKINTAKISNSQKSLLKFEAEDSEITQLRQEKLDSMYTLTFDTNVDSMTLEQIFEIYQDCITEKNSSYSSYGLERCEASSKNELIDLCGLSEEGSISS